jgi:orotate phosphoribosyltransferase-like protein
MIPIKNRREYPKAVKEALLNRYKELSKNKNIKNHGLQKQLANEFNVSYATVCRWVNNSKYNSTTALIYLEGDYIIYKGARYEPVCRVK